MIFNMVGGGGGSGATLVVSSPVNVSVTVSKDDKSYTKNSGSLGSTTFKGLATGTWTVTISGNGQTATRTIEITADYAITLAFFSATINITYPANSTCVVTNSSGQTVASDTNTTSSDKTWTATVNATGTYTVTATATGGSGNTKSESVEITSDGQSISITLNILPEIYQEVEYIQTTGTQYIDTGIKPIDRTYQVSTKIGVTTAEQDKCVFGTSGAVYYQLTPYTNQWAYGTNGNEGKSGTYKAIVGNEYIIEFNNSLYNIVINGDLIASGLTFINVNNSIKISSRNDSRLGKFKYYYFRIINNQTNDILMDLIPCYRRSDSVAGMYDLVSGNFFINSGTGTLLVGGDIA